MNNPLGYTGFHLKSKLIICNLLTYIELMCLITKFGFSTFVFENKNRSRFVESYNLKFD